MAETSSARFQNRRAMLDKEHALNTARNPGDSKYGNALYRNNTHEGRVYSAELTRIEKQLRITSMHIDQEKKQFLKKYALREPMLIVVRPPSPKAIQKQEWISYNAEHDYTYGHPKYRGGPRYMEPLKYRVRTPNYRPTIDAFCVDTKKKVNTWEMELLEREPPKFRSTVMPSYPLSTSEVRDLIKALDLHKQAMEAARKRPKRGIKKKERQTSATAKRGDSSTPWQFVTDVAPSAIYGDNSRDDDGGQSSSKHRPVKGNSGNGVKESSVTFSPSDDNVAKRKKQQDSVTPEFPATSAQLVNRSKGTSRPIDTDDNYPISSKKKLSTSATCIVRRDSHEVCLDLPVNTSVGVPSQQAATRETSSPSTEQEPDPDAPVQLDDDQRKSGMAVILEAAIDGMNSPVSSSAHN